MRPPVRRLAPALALAAALSAMTGAADAQSTRQEQPPVRPVIVCRISPREALTPDARPRPRPGDCPVPQLPKRPAPRSPRLPEFPRAPRQLDDSLPPTSRAPEALAPARR